MTRLLLILAIVCTGLAPGANCLYAASAEAIAVQAPHCEMVCCEAACCCVTENDPVSLPDTPATPPRGSDVAPIVLMFPSPIAWAWDDSSTYPSSDAGYAARVLPRAPRAVQPLICRWLT